MRPTLRFLDDALITQIVDEARGLLANLGMTINNKEALSMLGDHGADIDLSSNQVRFPADLIDRALSTAPSSFEMFDVLGERTHDFSGGKIHFTPGSAGIHILDHGTGKIRRPDTADYLRYVKLVGQLGGIDAQSTAFITSDVAVGVTDSYRLFLSLLAGEKPVVTGSFTIESMELMKNLQLAVRGTAEALLEKPLAIFSCCPTAPLKWSNVTCQNLLDCADHGIPVEYISMPLSGFMAPVTLVGTLVQHTAETLSGVVLSQLRRPGTPILYGGCPSSFDIRYETTPMGAVETQMVDCAYNEIGKFLGVPTQAYIGLTEAKALDAQAGLESASGAMMAALSGINSISGPGLLDIITCMSLEKLVLDNEIACIAQRLTRGIEPRDDFPAQPRFEELLRDKHLLISPHTMEHLNTEHYFPGPTIVRANLSRWQEEGGQTLGERAHTEVERLISEAPPSRLPDSAKSDLVNLMETEAKRHGMDDLPSREVD